METVAWKSVSTHRHRQHASYYKVHFIYVHSKFMRTINLKGDFCTTCCNIQKTTSVIFLQLEAWLSS